MQATNDALAIIGAQHADDGFASDDAREILKMVRGELLHALSYDNVAIARVLLEFFRNANLLDCYGSCVVARDAGEMMNIALENENRESAQLLLEFLADRITIERLKSAPAYRLAATLGLSEEDVALLRTRAESTRLVRLFPKLRDQLDDLGPKSAAKLD